MNADDTPTTPDDAAERFAAAVEGRPVEGRTVEAGTDEPGDPDLVRELEIVRRLAGRSTAFDPDPETRSRARQRLLAALAERTPDDGPSRAS